MEPQNNKTVIKLKGNAPDPVQLQSTKITGSIEAIDSYLKALNESQIKTYSQLDSCIIFQRSEFTICFYGNKNKNINTTVTGLLKTNPILKILGINEDKLHDRKSLEKLLRVSKMYFAEEDQWTRVFNQLREFKIKTEGNHETTDKPGDKKKLVEQKHSFEPIEFKMTLPLFEGIKMPYVFPVTIYADVTDANVRFFLESIDLTKLIHDEANKLMDEQETKLKSKGFAIINQ